MTIHPEYAVKAVRFRWCESICLALLCLAAMLGIARAQTPAPGHPPTAEQRRTYEERMSKTHPDKPGCFVAHYPDERWVETRCAPAPRTPNPRAQGPRPNTVGDGTDWFAVPSSGTISQVTGSFDKVSGIGNLLGPIGGDTSVVHPNAYAMQMNTNTFTPSVCGTLNNCAWVQFIFSQTQCTGGPCVFIEYWLLNHTSPCPTNAAWQFYDGSVPGTTPGCYLNTPATILSAVPLSELGSLKIIAQTSSSGNDIVTASDSSGTLGSASNASIANLASGWTGVEYNLVGDCCSTETFFTGSTATSLTLRVATVNGTTAAPTCASSFSGTTAESNNLSLTGGCSTVGGAAPAIVFTESGGGSLPPGVSVGDPHLTTFHGAHYDFQRGGEFILVEADPDLQVQVRQALITPPGKPAIAVNTGAAVKMGNTTFAATLKTTEVNRRARAIENEHAIELGDEVTVVRRGSDYTISRPSGDVVHVNVLADHVDVSVKLGATNERTVRGLLAGNPADAAHPMVGRDRKPVTGAVTRAALEPFVESWQVEPRESLFGAEGRPTPSGAVEPFTTAQLDREKAAQARKTCTERGVKAEALDDCILDVSVMGRPELADALVFAPKPTRIIGER